MNEFFKHLCNIEKAITYFRNNAEDFEGVSPSDVRDAYSALQEAESRLEDIYEAWNPTQTNEDT